MSNDKEVGGIPIPVDARIILSDMLAQLEEKYNFKHGSTAAFFHLAHVLSEHLAEGKK